VRGIRRHLVSTFGAWLVCYACTLAVTPITVCVALAQSAVECTSDHAGATICPMHHHLPATSKTGCYCRSVPSPDVATLVSVVSPLGIVPGRQAIDSPGRSIAPAPAFIAFLIHLPVLPESPPPRV
jgi:hypothetical protein